MTKPTPATLRTDSRIDWVNQFKFPDTSPGNALLQGEIDLAWAFCENATGRDFDTLTDATLTPLGDRAVKLQIVWQASQGVGGFPSIASDMEDVRSYAVPGYSQDRFDPRRGRDAGKRSYRIHPWSILDDLLWALCTEEKRAAYLREAQGGQEPFLGSAHEQEYLPTFGIDREYP